MFDDMRMRKLSEKTQGHYLRWVQRFAAYLERSPDTATVEDLRAMMKWKTAFVHARTP